MEIVQRYLKALGSLDWDGFADTLAEDGFERVGPFADVVSSKDAYVEFIVGIVSTLPEYAIAARRLVTSADGSVVLAEVTESFLIDGEPVAYPEALVFDLDGAGLIRRVQVYMMRPGEQAPVAGGSAEDLG